MIKKNKDIKSTIYHAQSSLLAPASLFKELFISLKQSRELILILFLRDLKSMYRQSILGYAWIIIPPLATTALWFYLTSQEIFKVSETSVPYPVFVMTGQVLWGTFVAAFNNPLQSFQAGQPVFTKLNVAAEAFVIAGMARVIFDLLIKTLLLIPFIVAFEIIPNEKLLLVPLALSGLILLGTAIGLLLVPLGSLYQDISKIMSLILPLLMYTTPVLYPPPDSGLAATIINLNPVTPLILSGRDWITGGEGAYLQEIMIIMLISLIMILLGFLMIRIFKPILVERMGM